MWVGLTVKEKLEYILKEMKRDERKTYAFLGHAHCEGKNFQVK